MLQAGQIQRGVIMIKYNLLWEYIRSSDDKTLILSFLQIEQIAGAPIDHSFLKYKKELGEYGWQVDKISMKNETVRFIKL